MSDKIEKEVVKDILELGKDLVKLDLELGQAGAQRLDWARDKYYQALSDICSKEYDQAKSAISQARNDIGQIKTKLGL